MAAAAAAATKTLQNQFQNLQILDLKLTHKAPKKKPQQKFKPMINHGPESKPL